MIRSSIFAAVALALGAAVADAQGPGGDPRALVGAALRAVEADSAAALRARWAERLRADSADRLAALGLTTLDRLTYDYASAERRYAALFADSAHPDPVAAYARLGLGQGLDARGQLAQADSQLVRAREAARRVGEPLAEADALLSLSFIRTQAEGAEVGFALLDSAQRLLPAAALDARGDLLRRRALLYAITGEADSAARLAATCVKVARQAGEPRTEAMCLRSQALNIRLQGQDDSALVILREIERLQRRARDRSALAETLLRLTDPYLNRGDLGLAKVALGQALVEAQASHNDLAAASVHTGLGALEIRLGDFAAADTNFRRASAMFAAQGDSSGLSNAAAYEAHVAAALGDLPRARERLHHVIAWEHQIGDVRQEFDARQALAEVELRARDWPATRQALDSTRGLALRMGRPLWLVELALDEGRVALAQGDLTRAEQRFNAYLQSRDSTQHLQRHMARTYLAEVYARRGEMRRAEDELIAAGRALDRWRAGLADRELRVLAFQAGTGDHLSRDASLARALASLAGAGRVEGAFALAEQRRARELVDRLNQAEALRVDSAARHRQPAMAEGDPGSGVAAAMAALPDDRTALIEYVTGTDAAPTTVFVVTRRGIRARVTTAADSLAGRIERFTALLESGADPRPLARSLGDAVIAPALALLPSTVDRLLIVPDGPLHRIPFDALRLADGRAVVERYTTAVTPSAAVLAALRQRPAAHPAGGPGTPALLALGDPAFAREQGGGLGRGEALRGEALRGEALRGEALRDAFEAAGGLPRLTGAGDEVRDVARYARAAVVRVREGASEAFLKHTPLGRYRVIHLATHALVDEASLARTALALAPGGGEDGFLAPADLAALRLDADLVVLSACRTAGGVLVAGEGLQGLTAPLLEAGARSVVATRWRIGDRATVRLVDDLYAALAAGRPVAEALRAAKLAALRRGAPARDWAAFTVTGDPFTRVALAAPPPPRARWPEAVGGAALLALAAAYLAVRRRGRRGDRGEPEPGVMASTHH